MILSDARIDFFFPGLMRERRHWAENRRTHKGAGRRKRDSVRCGQFALRPFRATSRPNTAEQEPEAGRFGGGSWMDTRDLRAQKRGICLSARGPAPRGRRQVRWQGPVAGRAAS